MNMIKSYSDFCNTKWAEVWDVNIVEFFSTIAFIRQYRKAEADEIKRMMKK